MGYLQQTWKEKFAEITVDPSQNIVRVKYGSLSPTHDEFERHLEDLESTLRLIQPSYYIVDGSYSSMLPFSMAKRMSQWQDEHSKEIALKTLFAAFVLPNPISRLAFNTIFQFKKPYSPYRIVSSAKQAEELLLELMQQVPVKQGNAPTFWCEMG